MFRRLVSIGVAAAGFALAGALPPTSAQTPQEPQIHAWLDRYVAGDNSAATALGLRPIDRRLRVDDDGKSDNHHAS